MVTFNNLLPLCDLWLRRTGKQTIQVKVLCVYITRLNKAKSLYIYIQAKGTEVPLELLVYSEFTTKDSQGDVLKSAATWKNM